MGPESTSPVPPKNHNIEPVKMDFPNAMRAVINGKLITRLEWGNGDYCLLQETWLRIFTTSDNKFHDWLINDGDMLANDWIVVREEQKAQA